MLPSGGLLSQVPNMAIVGIVGNIPQSLNFCKNLDAIVEINFQKQVLVHLFIKKKISFSKV